MIIGALIAFLADSFTWILGFLPNTQGLPPQIGQSFNYLISSALGLDYYFPVALLLRVFAIYVAVLLAFLVYSAIKFFISMFRGVDLN